MYPHLEPYETGHLDVGDGHNIYYEVSGNPDGVPAVYFHGGPGGGSHPDMRRFFNPEHYKVILFDQRGAGQSTPFASLENNTIPHLVSDIDQLRKHLGVDKWIVVGGSWGSTLALFYALEHSNDIEALILSGICFADMQGVYWLTEEGGASEIMPEWFWPYRDLIPPEKRKGGLYNAYYDIIVNGTEEDILEASRLFTMWDTAILYFDVPFDRIREVEEDPEGSVALTSIFFHFVKKFFNDSNKDLILDGAKKLGHIPCHIVHGRYDLICPVRRAYELHRVYPNSELHILHATGHTTREPNIARKIVEITDKIAGIENVIPTYIRDV